MSGSSTFRGGGLRRVMTFLALAALLAAAPGPSALAAVGDVSGRLVGPAGEPLTGFVVQLVGPEGAVAESRATDASGRFQMQNVPPGRYDFQLLSEDRMPCEASIAPAVMPEAGSLEIDVRLTTLPACGSAGDPVEPAPDPPARAGRAGGRSKLWTGLGIGGGVALLLAAAGGGSDDPPPPVSPTSP